VSVVYREDREGAAGKWGDRAEVPLVEAHHAIGFVPIGDHHERTVGKPQF